MKRLFYLALVLLALCLCACEAKKEEENGGTAVLFSSLAEIWLEAGGRVDITVGETVERGFAPKGTPLVDGGAGKNINIELLLSLKPSLVISSADIPAQAEIIPILQKAGIKTLSLKVEDFDDYLSALDAMTDLTNNKEPYKNALHGIVEKVVSITESERINAIKDTRILFIRAGSTASSTKTKTSKDHFAAAMLRELGCINIADEAGIPGAELDMEAILAADPDFIFFSLMGNEVGARTNIESMLESDTWSALDAVKEGRAVILPRELFHFKPCSRWAEAYGYLADILCGG